MSQTLSPQEPGSDLETRREHSNRCLSRFFSPDVLDSETTRILPIWGLLGPLSPFVVSLRDRAKVCSLDSPATLISSQNRSQVLLRSSDYRAVLELCSWGCTELVEGVS